jgi:hypothetical protein
MHIGQCKLLSVTFLHELILINERIVDMLSTGASRE